MIKRFYVFLLFFCSLMFLASVHAQNYEEYFSESQMEEIKVFIDEMVNEHGFSREYLENVFNNVRRRERIIKLVSPAPSNKPKNWRAYKDRFIEPQRINAGVAFWNKYKNDLSRAEREFGVPAEIIVGIIGVETLFGRVKGNFRLMDALTTLAFDYPYTQNREKRMAFFRSELKETLLFARESGINPFDLRGSYAGAIGFPQFMPGSIRKFGVDYDGDGKVDLRHSVVDSIGSVANYLAKHGWMRGEPIVFRADVSHVSDNDLSDILGQGLEAKYYLRELDNYGVVTQNNAPKNIKYGLIDLQNAEMLTEYWVATNNFFAITQYNRSYFYAMSVVELGKEISYLRAK